MNFRALFSYLGLFTTLFSASASAQGVAIRNVTESILRSESGQRALQITLGGVGGQSLAIAAFGESRWAELEAHGTQAIAAELLTAANSASPEVRRAAQVLIGRVNVAYRVEYVRQMLTNDANAHKSALRSIGLVNARARALLAERERNAPPRHIPTVPKRLAADIKLRLNGIDPALIDQIVGQWTSFLSKPSATVRTFTVSAPPGDDETRRAIHKVITAITDLTLAKQDAVLWIDTNQLRADYSHDFYLFGSPVGFVSSDRGGLLTNWADNLLENGSGVGIVLVSGRENISSTFLPRMLNEALKTGRLKANNGSVRSLDKLLVIRVVQ